MKRAFVITAFLFTWVVAMGAQSVPNPIVTGPIPATVAPGDPSHNYPFFSTNIDLASRGYVEEEFFFEGMANTYDMNPNVPSRATAQITSSGRFYRTRMIVRRPISAEQFNGTVIMEWQNVTGGFEPDAVWLESHEHLIRRGYAWVGVSAQRAGVVFLKTSWSPARYGSLNIPNTNTSSPFMGDKDGLSWDIFSQAAQAMRHPQGIDPMGGLGVECLFAVGWSQSANRLADYYNSIHPLAHVFDAFALVGLDGPVLRPLRTDQDAKVFKVQNETNVAGITVADSTIVISQALLNIQEPNTDRLRRWEIPGASQLGYHAVQEANPLQLRDGLPPITDSACDKPGFSHIPWHFALNAAYDHMVEWVKQNVAPPIGDDIKVVSYGNFSVLGRDVFGNAIGGIRLSQHAVATATNTGLNTPAGDKICGSIGSYQPFDEGTLQALYPDHQTYLGQVIAATHETQSSGFIVGPDAAETIRDAGRSDIGRR
jgi:hypothetical protein